MAFSGTNQLYSIPTNLKVFVQKQHEAQERQEIDKFTSFTTDLHELFGIIIQLLREAYFTPKSLVLGSKEDCAHLITQRTITFPSAKEKSPVGESELQSVRRMLEFVEMMAFISLIGLKKVDLLSPIERLYEHFGPSFQATHEFLSSSEIDDVENLNENLKCLIREQIQKSYFFQTLRPLELRWFQKQPHRFLALIDHIVYDQSVIDHHLVWVRNLSDRELTFLIELPEESWKNLIQALDSPTYLKLFGRYHIFSLCSLAVVMQSEHKVITRSPLETVSQYLAPFFPPLFQDRLMDLSLRFPECLSEAQKRILDGSLLPFLEIQLLEEEQEWTRILLKSFVVLEAKEKGSHSNRSKMSSQLLYLSIYKELTQQNVFLEHWSEIKKNIHPSPQDAKIVQLDHPYWKDLFVSESRQFHQSASEFVQEAQKYQQGVAQKDYYPTYYNYWSYFVVAWIVAAIIIVLFIVALSAYGAHRTQITRIYLASAVPKNTK